MLDEVGLVDDVDQVLRFGDAPEHAVHAQAQLPFPSAGFAEHEKIGLAQIGRACGASPRRRSARKRRYRETPVPPAFEMEFRLNGETAHVGALFGMGAPSGDTTDRRRPGCRKNSCSMLSAPRLAPARRKTARMGTAASTARWEKRRGTASAYPLQAGPG